MTQLFHQLGYRYLWNFDSHFQDGTGSGFIIGPRHIELENVTRLDSGIRRMAIFDPQFYLPNSSAGYLTTYPFFPHVVAGGFSTREWDDELAARSANQCLEFQNSAEFSHIVIPTRYLEGMPSNYIDSQMLSFVEPFLRAYRASGITTPCLLQLVLTDLMIKDEAYMRDILNWITGISEIGGLYLIYPWPSRRKQIEDIDFLIAMMSLIREIKNAGMVAALGYVNTESILYLAADPDIITMGSYGNLRMFDTAPYESREGKKPRPPTPRIYSSTLLQWIEHPYLNVIRRQIDGGESFFDGNGYRDAMFISDYRWYFQKPEPYKHYFMSFWNQFRRLVAYNGIDRARAIQEELERAMSGFRQLEEHGVRLTSESNGNHLPMWLTALNAFLSSS